MNTPQRSVLDKLKNPFSDHTPEQKKVIILSSIATSSMVLGIISIMPLVPMLADKFGVSISHAAWSLIATYTLPGIVFAPLAGMLADRYGRKAILVPAFALFSIAGGACAFAPNLETLAWLRFLQGIGAAPLGALNVTIIGDAYSGPMRARMIGYSMSLVSVCNALYPALGGFLSRIDWWVPFALPLLTIPVAWVAYKTPLLAPHKNNRILEHIKTAKTIFTPRTSAMLTMTLITFFLLFGIVITCFPALAKIAFKATPPQIGMMMTLFSVGAGFISIIFGRLVTSFSTRRLLASSLVMYSIGIVSFPLMPSLPWLMLPLLVFGAGHGLNVPCVQSLLVKAVAPEQRGTLMSLNSMLTRIGQTTGPLVCSLLFETINFGAPFYTMTLMPCLLIYVTFTFIPAHMPIEQH